MFILLAVIALIAAVCLVAIPLKKNRVVSGLSSLILVFGVVIGYAYWGSNTQWITYEHDKDKQLAVKKLLKTGKGIEVLILKMKAKIQEAPDNPKGWYLLGRLYANQQAWILAVQSFKKAYGLDPEDIATAVNYGQALWQKNNQKFTPEIREIFQQLLDKNPDQPDALAMLALDYHAENNFLKAIELWEHLLMLTPPQSEEARSIREAIAQASRRL